MRFRRKKLLSRFIVLCAFLQMVAPSVAAIADAWAERNTTRVLQIGEQGSSKQLPAHPEDCVLCVATAAITGTGDARPTLPEVQLEPQAPVAGREVRHSATARRVASQRAPPVLS